MWGAKSIFRECFTMLAKLKCYDCKNLVAGLKDEGTAGGGCENVIRCAARPEIEEAVRKELKYYGNSGSPFSSWLCGQAAIDENSIGGEGAESRFDDPNCDEETDFDAVDLAIMRMRDPAWEAWDEYLATLPRMLIVNDTGLLRDREGNEIRRRDGSSFGKGLVTAYVRGDYENEWLLRREEQIAEDVLWRAQKGGCKEFVRKDFEVDEVVQTHYDCPDLYAGMFEREELVDEVVLDQLFEIIAESEFTLLEFTSMTSCSPAACGAAC